LQSNLPSNHLEGSANDVGAVPRGIFESSVLELRSFLRNGSSDINRHVKAINSSPHHRVAVTHSLLLQKGFQERRLNYCFFSRPHLICTGAESIVSVEQSEGIFLAFILPGKFELQRTT
jgi:hypothetical protein